MDRVCIKCGISKPLSSFRSYNGKYIKSCKCCRDNKLISKLNKLYKEDIKQLYTNFAISKQGNCIITSDKIIWKCSIGHTWIESYTTVINEWCKRCSHNI